MSNKKFNKSNFPDSTMRSVVTDETSPYVEDNYKDRDYRPVRQRRDGKTGCLGGLMYFVFIISVSVILACVAWMAATDVLALNKKEITADIVLPETIFSKEERKVENADGTTEKKEVTVTDIGEVSTILKDAGIIEYKGLFRLFSAFSNADIKIDPGTYTLNTQLDYRAIVKKMQFGSDSQVRTTVTIPEGFNLEQIFNRLEENKICKYEDLMECAANEHFNENYKFLTDIPYDDASRLEGFLFPDTYEFYQGMTAKAALDKLLYRFYKKQTAEMIEIAQNKGLTMRDVVNIASMIEKEAANDTERPIIASVIFNRLKADMFLGIDATLLYDYPDFNGDMSTVDTHYDSLYNTRVYKGLPPTPIANPGIASINAVIKPATTNYYYYALDTETGTHKFFTNINDHTNFTATQSY